VTDILFAIAMLKVKAVFLELNEGLELVKNENGDIAVAINFAK
jgi:hypothetical protein